MLEIKEIQPTKKNLKAFTKFQIDLYDGNPWYVPPLISDDVQTLSPSLNPAHDFCDQVLYMAYRDGKVVGRIAGIINRQVNEKERERAARFGFIDFVDDPEVSAALLGAPSRGDRNSRRRKLRNPQPPPEKPCWTRSGNRSPACRCKRSPQRAARARRPGVGGTL